jgi:hypothetical protein
MLVTVLQPVGSSSSSDWSRLVLPASGREVDRSARVFQPALAAARERGLPLVIEARDRPHVSEALRQTARHALGEADAVVVISPVTDTIRTIEGRLVDRGALVEVGSPMVLGGAAVAALVADSKVRPAIASILGTLLASGVEIVTVPGDGSDGWAGAPDHEVLTRARVGR